MDGPSRANPASSSPGLVVRDAVDDDLPSMVALLNDEIAESAFVYAEHPVTAGERRAWLDEHRSNNLPVLVAVDPASGAVCGWAALSPYRPSSGYRFTAELSVYVDRRAHRRGIGSRLVEALVDAAHAGGLHAIVGSVDADNSPSTALLARFGFVEAARLPEVGRKFGQWRTQLLMLLILRAGGGSRQ